ncbi:unnamed protein product [Peniophora sp. CBMAI 1063]|nr:unnamed protein product [Peniophora sp. CBMAI 1063]
MVMRGMNKGKNKRQRKEDNSRHFLAPRGRLPRGSSYTDLSLQSVTATSRSLVLDLGKAIFQFQFLTHTNIQFYTPENWEAVKETPRFKYGTSSEQRMITFHVAIAFDFGDFVLSFNSHDLVFLPTWTTVADAAAGKLNHTDTLDMVNDFDGYLEHIADWLSTVYPLLPDRTKEKSMYKFMRDEATLFSGIGVYSRSEIFIRSGVSPEMTLCEVVENRSRFYRIILSTLEFKLLVDRLWLDFVLPVIRNDLVAPTDDERGRFTASLLCHAQDVVKAPERFRAAVERYNKELEVVPSLDTGESSSIESSSSLGKGDLSEVEEEEVFQDIEEVDVHASDFSSYDPVEPMFFVNALRLAPEFGPAIFGVEYWALHLQELGPCTTRDHNPVVNADIQSGAFYSGSHVIDTSRLDTLVLPTHLMKKAHIPNGLYNFTDSDKIWTPLTILSGWPKKNIKAFFFKTIVRTKNIVVIGILEFSGNAVAIRRAGPVKRKNQYLAIPSRGVIPSPEYIGYSTAERNLISSIKKVDAKYIAKGDGDAKGKGRAKVSLAREALRVRQSAKQAFQEMWVDRFGWDSVPNHNDELSELSSSAPGSPPATDTDIESADVSRAATPPPDQEPSSSARGHKRIRSDQALIRDTTAVLEENTKRARRDRGIGMIRSVHPLDDILKDLK